MSSLSAPSRIAFGTRTRGLTMCSDWSGPDRLIRTAMQLRVRRRRSTPSLRQQRCPRLCGLPSAIWPCGRISREDVTTMSVRTPQMYHGCGEVRLGSMCMGVFQVANGLVPSKDSVLGGSSANQKLAMPVGQLVFQCEKPRLYEACMSADALVDSEAIGLPGAVD